MLYRVFLRGISAQYGGQNAILVYSTHILQLQLQLPSTAVGGLPFSSWRKGASKAGFGGQGIGGEAADRSRRLTTVCGAVQHILGPLVQTFPGQLCRQCRFAVNFGIDAKHHAA